MSIKQEEIVGRVITLQSVRYDGSYADNHHSYQVRVTQCNYTDVPNAVWTRFLVHEGKDGLLIFESFRYRNYYMDAHHDGTVHLTHSPNPPLNAIWAQWRLVNPEDDIVALETERYRGSYLDAHHSGECRTTQGKPSDIWARWHLAVGPGQGIKDGYDIVSSFDNKLDKEVKYTYRKVLGVSITEGSSTTLTTSLSQELSVNFEKGPLKIGSKTSIEFSKQWSTSEAKTWSETTEVTAEINVPPLKKVLVSQLRAKYGPLEVHSNHIRADYSELDQAQ